MEKNDPKARKARIMAHLVAYYPDRELTYRAACGLIDGGVSYLELQFPYSDPSADGPAIQKACSTALSSGFSKEEGFSLVREILSYKKVPLFIMSYAGLVFSGGVGEFVLRAKEAGASGLIVPDLMPGYDEGLYAAGRREGMMIVPVLAPSVSEERIETIGRENPEFVYAALRTGVTGKKTEVGGVDEFLARAGRTGGKIIAGFGIQSRGQVEALMDSVHALVVGSYIVRAIEEAVGKDREIVYHKVKKRIEELVVGGGKKT